MTVDERDALRGRLVALGFDEVRFATSGEIGKEPLARWLDAGHHADMAWIARNADKRVNPGLVLEGAASLILLGVNYFPGYKENAAGEKPVWARYALYQDYHDTMKEGLVAAGKELEASLGLTSADYRFYVDTGPVLERAWAQRSGMGFVGKNAMLISRSTGNWLFLAAIVVRATLPPDAPLAATAKHGGDGVGHLCGKCTRCLDACPTGALTEPGVVDARRCISYLTIENKGAIPREWRAAIGNRIYGCDICAEVCPWNRFAHEGRRLLLSARFEVADMGLQELLTLTSASFAALFKGTPIKRIKLTGVLRNACVVAGNLKARECLPALVSLAGHELALVRAHAVWAVRQIAGEEAQGLLADCRTRETDVSVISEYV